MKKILIISSTPFFGGAEQFIVSTLTKLETDYELYFFVVDKKTATKLENRNIYISTSALLLFKLIELQKFIKKVKPDLLFFNGSNISYFLPLFKNYKTIYYRHTTNLYASKQRRWLFKIIMNVIYRRASLTIHVSQYSLSEQKTGKGICIHNGINILPDIRHTESLSAPLKVLFCSRLEKPKGIREIVKAFNSINPEIAQLTIIGDGNEKSWVTKNISNSIEYLGFQKDVTGFYKDADVMILMSEFENFPISVIEALNYGLPVITTGAGGISEMITDGYNGLIIKSKPEEIIHAVEKLKKNRSMLKFMGENSRKFCVENLDINDKIKEIRDAINNTLSK